MARSRIAKISILCVMVWLCASILAAASEYHGQVSFGGQPLPGATVTVTQGGMKVATVTDADGNYAFPELPDGSWVIGIEMQCFAPIKAEVNVAPNTPAGKWELTLLPPDRIMEKAQAATPEPDAPPTPSVAEANKPEAAEAPKAAAPETPKPPEEANDQIADGLLINGSMNDAATSRFSTAAAFGNTRSGGRVLYNGGLEAIFDNSAIDARPYSLSGLEAPKSFYDRFTGSIGMGGPISIPHVLPHGPFFYASYQWTRDNNAAIVTGLVPTKDEREGNLSGLLDAQGQPVTIYNPATGAPYPNNQVPVRPQAQYLLSHFYQQLIPNIAGLSGYNYQAPVLNSNHQDALFLRLNKSIAHAGEFSGRFNLQSTRASNTNLFGFVDTTGTLGINSNINWQHYFSRQRMNLKLGYTFSRQRTSAVPYFQNRENVALSAGINGTASTSGNNQDPADWGPTALNFSSGIAALSDGNSSFNRTRSDGLTASAIFYHGRHNIAVGGDFNKQDINDFFQQNPRGSFTFTGAATQAIVNGVATGGSDLADFLIGRPDTSSIAFGNADKYFREPVYDAFVNDDWRILSILTINAGVRWQYGAPITELFGRLVNLDIADGFTAIAPVLGSDPVGSLTGSHYPSSLLRPDRNGVEPRIGISWRPVPASTILVRAGYGIYHDTSVYQNIVLQMAQQAPLSTSLSVANSSACPLTLSEGFTPCSSVTPDTFAIDPNYRVGYAQAWQLGVQRDLPLALQLTATYSGVKGTHGAQEILPNSYPTGEDNPCPDCPSGFVYQTSGGNSTRQAGQLQLRRRMRNGFSASLTYTYSKSIDDDAYLGGLGHVTASGASQGGAASSGSGTIAQNWLDPQAERSLSTFDQRHLLNVTAQYTTGEGLGGGTLMSGWRGRVLKEWTVLTTITRGTGLPETPIYPAAVSGTGYTGSIRPDLTGASIYNSSANAHLNAAAYTAPLPGQWGTAGRDSITGPGQFSLDSSLQRIFRPHGRLSLDFHVDATNLLNHGVISSWNTTVGNAQFGLPVSANPMRSLRAAIRLRF